MKVKYRRSVFTVSNKHKPERCAACGAMNCKLDMHHYAYVYTTAEVRKDHELAVENTIPLCFHCHMLADALRIIGANTDAADMVLMAIKERVAAAPRDRGDSL